MSGDYRFDTLMLHAGQVPDKHTGARAVPIYQTTSYVFQDSDHAAALFNMELGGHIYRLTNPTVAALEQRVAALEGGVAAVAASSGMSALFLTILALTSAGDPRCLITNVWRQCWLYLNIPSLAMALRRVLLPRMMSQLLRPPSARIPKWSLVKLSGTRVWM